MKTFTSRQAAWKQISTERVGCSGTAEVYKLLTNLQGYQVKLKADSICLFLSYERKHKEGVLVTPNKTSGKKSQEEQLSVFFLLIQSNNFRSIRCLGVPGGNK